MRKLAVIAAVCLVPAGQAALVPAADAASAGGWSVTKGAGQVTAAYVKLWSNGSAVTRVTGTGRGRHAVWMKADLCDGAPQVRVLVNGKAAGTFAVTNNRGGAWQYPLSIPLPRGTVRLEVRLLNDYGRRGCDRNVYITKISPYKDTTNPFNVGAPFAEPWFRQNVTSAAKSAGSAYDRKALATIASRPTATWLGPWVPSGYAGRKVSETIAAAKKEGKTPVFVLYGMRGCVTSPGGIGESGYYAWVGEIAHHLANHRAAVILEPDALGFAGTCRKNIQYIRGAMDILGYHKATSVYIDAGHHGWASVPVMTARLKAAGVSKARGFSLNVANSQSDRNTRAYGDKIAKALGKRYVIDTARNGKVVRGTCNPPGAAVGIPPRSYEYGYQDASLWIKPPGESDGTCNGGPAAGVFMPGYAVSMVRNAGWRL